MVLNGIGMNLISTIVKSHDKLASFFIHGRCLVKISYLLREFFVFISTFLFWIKHNLSSWKLNTWVHIYYNSLLMCHIYVINNEIRMAVRFPGSSWYNYLHTIKQIMHMYKFRCAMCTLYKIHSFINIDLVLFVK